MIHSTLNTLARIPSDAELDQNPEALFTYFLTRSKQVLHEGYTWNGQFFETLGCPWTVFHHRTLDAYYASISVPESLRGQRLLQRVQESIHLPIMTVDDCDIEQALIKMNIPHVVAGRPILQSAEYQLIQSFYQDQRAKRSGVFLQMHIDEGLAILAATGASHQAMRAYCLHPLLQNDIDLGTQFTQVAQKLNTLPDGATIMGLAMEYHSVANAYLSHHQKPITGIHLSPLAEVNQMLMADKIQNRKDFNRYHKSTHPNSARLTVYFEEWIDALGIRPQADALTQRLEQSDTPFNPHRIHLSEGLSFLQWKNASYCSVIYD